MRNALLALFFAAAAAAAQPAPRAGEAFALVVGDSVIGAAEYEAALRNALRQKFYHRRIPDSQLDAFQREVAGELIEGALVLAEAKRRGVTPERLHAEARAVAPPGDAELRAYYESRGALFVEPERIRVSVIVLKVDPSSPPPQWERARAEAQALRASLEAGAEFAEAARLRSADETAGRGGDMGYLHRGMIPEPLYVQLEAMKPGELSQPVRLLEGIALFKLQERIAARSQAFDEARARAAELWRREQGEARWKALVASLRAAASIRVDAVRYPALSGIAP